MAGSALARAVMLGERLGVSLCKVIPGAGERILSIVALRSELLTYQKNMF